MYIGRGRNGVMGRQYREKRFRSLCSAAPELHNECIDDIPGGGAGRDYNKYRSSRWEPVDVTRVAFCLNVFRSGRGRIITVSESRLMIRLKFNR